jgi:hypothetical protein
VRVCTQSRKDAADVGTLEGIGNLDSEESEAYVPQLPERKLSFLHIKGFSYFVSV